MMSQDLISYINRPSLLDENTIFDLTLISEKYPYFQTAQLLRIKNLFNISPEAIKPALNYTAAYVTDRKVLYYLLHPIKTETKQEQEQETEPIETRNPEKDVKDTIEENISDTLENQKHYLETNSDDEIEFSTAINVKKEYGEGVKLEEYVVRITENGPELYELLEDEKPNIKPATEQEDQTKSTKTIRPDEDILTLINKGVSAEKVLGEDAIDLNDNQKRNNSIIDNFIKINPKIKPETSTAKQNKDFSAESVQENEHLITDTLANIYVKQGNYAKAIFAYEKLSLKYPEKSAYFAGQIEEIKKLIEKTK